MVKQRANEVNVRGAQKEYDLSSPSEASDSDSSSDDFIISKRKKSSLKNRKMADVIDFQIRQDN